MEQVVKHYEETWFDKMAGYLHWKIIGPDINNPYTPRMSDKILSELAYQQDALRRRLVLRCMCDGYEVLQIKNLCSPMVKTDHPCISSISAPDLLSYLLREGIEDRINQEVARIQAEMKEELKRREQEDRENPQPVVIKRRNKKSPTPQPERTQFRIVRR